MPEDIDSIIDPTNKIKRILVGGTKPSVSRRFAGRLSGKLHSNIFLPLHFVFCDDQELHRLPRLSLLFWLSLKVHWIVPTLNPTSPDSMDIGLPHMELNSLPTSYQNYSLIWIESTLTWRKIWQRQSQENPSKEECTSFVEFIKFIELNIFINFMK